VTNGSRFDVRVTADSHVAWVRTRLALERTMMAWLRTATSLIGFGFGIMQVFERLQHDPASTPAIPPNAPKYLGLAMITSGILSALIAACQYRWTVRYLWGPTFAPIAGMTREGLQSPVVVIAVLLVLIGLFAFSAVLLRLA
jgi:putative membrane protein